MIEKSLKKIYTWRFWPGSYYSLQKNWVTFVCAHIVKVYY
jgi:hypothetical protein